MLSLFLIFRMEARGTNVHRFIGRSHEPEHSCLEDVLEIRNIPLGVD